MIKENHNLVTATRGSFKGTQRPTFSRIDVQRGASLVVTMIVLLALTAVAIGVTSSNQSQSIMVRNNQFRLETFNVSYAEIDAQIDAINRRKISEGDPSWMSKLLNNDVGDRVWYGATNSADVMTLLVSTPSTFVTRGGAHEYRGNCIIEGEQIGIGKESYQCNEIELESSAKMTDTSVESDQRQVYEYYTKN